MKIKLWIDTGFVGGKMQKVVDIDPADIEGMTPDEQDNYFDELADQYRDEKIYCGWDLVEEA